MKKSAKQVKTAMTKKTKIVLVVAAALVVIAGCVTAYVLRQQSSSSGAHAKADDITSKSDLEQAATRLEVLEQDDTAKDEADQEKLEKLAQ